MAKKTLSGSLALTKLLHVPMEANGKNGKVKGLFIPIEANHFVVGKEKDGVTPIYMPINIVMFEERNENGQDGLVSQQGNVKWKEATDAQKEVFKKLPILGNVIDWSKGGDGNDNAGAASTETFAPDDKLPF
jgi:hypothetical protein